MTQPETWGQLPLTASFPGGSSSPGEVHSREAHTAANREGIGLVSVLFVWSACLMGTVQTMRLCLFGNRGPWLGVWDGEVGVGESWIQTGLEQANS